MSDNASVYWRQQYTNRVTAIYQQRGGKLRGMTIEPTSFDGSSKAYFYLAGKVVSYETTHARQQNKASGQGHTRLEVDLRTFTVYDEIYEFDEDRMSVDENELTYEAGAMAIGRRADVEIFNAAYAAVTTFTTGCDFSSAAFSAVSAQTMIMAMQTQMKNWGEEDVFCALPQQAWNEFLLNKAVHSADYVNRDDLPFMKATESRFWGGVNWFLYLEEDAEDMYPIPASDKQDTIMWARSALGWAPHTDMQVRTQWHNEIDTLSINMKMKGNAVASRNGVGIVRARLRSAGTLAVV